MREKFKIGDIVSLKELNNYGHKIDWISKVIPLIGKKIKITALCIGERCLLEGMGSLRFKERNLTKVPRNIFETEE